MKIKNYKVSWKHNNHNANRIPKSAKLSKRVNEPVQNVKGSTECYLTDLNDPNIAYTGKTVVHQNDNYDKRMGRYLSFSKAVSQISDPSERKELWSEILATGLITTKQIIK
jgi:hypothetical protein